MTLPRGEKPPVVRHHARHTTPHVGVTIAPVATHPAWTVVNRVKASKVQS
jgi:hypothetical protein